jgi:GTP-binding protein
MTGGRGREIVLADLPGLIKGAAQGRGLGDKFLRHTERCQVLVHVISAENGSASSVKEAYQTVRSELAAWSAQGQMDLLKKPEIVVLSKIDLGVPPGRVLKGKVLKVSAHTGEGLPELVAEIVQVLKKAATTATTTKPADPANNKPSKVFTIENLPNKSIVFRKRGLPR